MNRPIRWTGIACLAAAAVCGSLAAAPDDGERAGVLPAGKLHLPQDTAPPEQVIVPRPTVEARPKGSLLAQAEAPARQIDVDELYRRKRLLYGGGGFSDSLPGTGPEAPLARRRQGALTRVSSRWGQLTFWLLVSVAGLTTCVLLIKTAMSRLRTRSS
jgi:hypothetical protein